MRKVNLSAVLKRHRVKPGQLVAACGISWTAYGYWRTGQRRPTPEHVIQAEKALGIPRWELRPDIWEPPAKPQKAELVEA